MIIGIPQFYFTQHDHFISSYMNHLVKELEVIGEKEQVKISVYKNENEFILQELQNISAPEYRNHIEKANQNQAMHRKMLEHWCKETRYDILFLPTIGGMIPFAFSRPKVATFHGDPSFHPTLMGGVKGSMYSYAFRKQLDQYTSIITPNEALRNFLIDAYDINQSKVSAVPMACNHNIFHGKHEGMAAGRILKRFGIKTPYIVTEIGNNSIEVMPALLHAFETMKKVHHIPHQLIVTRSGWVNSDSILLDVMASEYKHDIVILESVSDKELCDLYNAADAFLYACMWDTANISLLKAIACGVPVACSDLPSCKEVIGDQGITFNTLDPESIIDAVLPLLTDRGYHDEKMTLSLQRSQLFSWRQTAQKTIEVLRNALN